MEIRLRIFVNGYTVATMAKRPSNPLALAVLALLFERPMHPYEMAATLKERGKDDSIKIRYGSLYTVIDQLLRERLIAVRETIRDGGRPERTIYTLTDVGIGELGDWMRDLLSRPAKEYPQFEAGLTLLPVLPPDEAIEMLQRRIAALDPEIAALRGLAPIVEGKPLHPIHLIETDYRLSQLEAERGFVAKLIARIANEDWPTSAGWSEWHKSRRMSKGGER